MEILIVEDEILIALEMQRILEDEGHCADGLARTADDAVTIAGRQRPDLALIDVHLAHGTDGVAAGEAMWRLFETPSILVSAFGEEARRAAPYAIGCLRKPFTPPELLEAVRIGARFLDGRAPVPGPHNFEFYIPPERFALAPNLGPHTPV
jgi:two-component system, response regulator PdtaR